MKLFEKPDFENGGQWEKLNQTEIDFTDSSYYNLYNRIELIH